MTNRRFLIGSGFYAPTGEQSYADFFFPIWLNNTVKSTSEYNESQSAFYVICVGDKFPLNIHPKVRMIRLSGNLGHVGQLLSGEMPYHLCGWSSTVLTLAMLAYTNESDFIYKEQDCLAFGPWIDTLYEEIGDAGMIFGSCKLMPAAQSLFLVKHEYIPKFVRRYLSGEPERTDAWLPEKKFARMESESPDKVKRFSFPFDRDRPLDYSRPVWYAQKFTPAELKEMHDQGLIYAPDVPDLKVFSSTE